MLLYFHPKIYEKIKNNSDYVLIHSELESIMLDGDITSLFWEKNKDLFQKYLKVKNLIDKVEKTEEEKILWDINCLMSYDYENLIKNNELESSSIDYRFRNMDWVNEELTKIENRIELLNDVVEKETCRIYFLQHKLVYLMQKEGHGFFSEEVINYRKKVIQSFEIIKNKTIDDDTISTYFYNFLDLIIIDFLEQTKHELNFNDCLNYFNKTKILIDKEIDILKNLKIKSNYLRLNDCLEINKINFIQLFYKKIMSISNLNWQEKRDLDNIIMKYKNKNNFKYKKFNILDLHFYWIRMRNFMPQYDAPTYDIFLKIYDELCLYVKYNLQDKKFVIKSLIYNANQNHYDFMVFLKNLLLLDELLSNFFKIEKKLINLNLSQKELDFLSNDKLIIDSNDAYYINLDWLKNRFYG